MAKDWHQWRTFVAALHKIQSSDHTQGWGLDLCNQLQGLSTGYLYRKVLYECYLYSVVQRRTKMYWEHLSSLPWSHDLYSAKSHPSIQYYALVAWTYVSCEGLLQCWHGHSQGLLVHLVDGSSHHTFVEIVQLLTVGDWFRDSSRLMNGFHHILHWIMGLCILP